MVRGQSVEALADPAPYRPRRADKRKASLLREFASRKGDPNCGGSSRRPLMTAYRQDALRCARVIGQQGPAKVGDIRKAAQVERAGGVLLNDVYGWFERRGRGLYGLSAKGTAALAEFAATLALL